jgi:hypothetical protein
MLAFNPTSISKSVPVSDLCVLCVSVFRSPNLSPFNFKLPALSVVEGSTFNSVSLTPFPATLTSSLQITEKPATLTPAFATLTDIVTHKSFVCHSYKKHLGWGYPLLLRELCALCVKVHPRPQTCRSVRHPPQRAHICCSQTTHATAKPFKRNAYKNRGECPPDSKRPSLRPPAERLPIPVLALRPQ